MSDTTLLTCSHVDRRSARVSSCFLDLLNISAGVGVETVENWCEIVLLIQLLDWTCLCPLLVEHTLIFEPV